MNAENRKDEHHGDRGKGGPPRLTLRIQTPRGLWSMTEPENAALRPEYAISTKIEQVIRDARSVFGFVEEDSKYTLLQGRDPLAPERTLASYQMEDSALLILSIQGGNA